jgi:predicted MarR family transcription regulator
MKKYELKNYKEFSDQALVCPPIEEFEDGTIDEEQWYEEHKVKIVVGEHEIELPYFADVISEIEFALEEMYDAVEGWKENKEDK